MDKTTPQYAEDVEEENQNIESIQVKEKTSEERKKPGVSMRPQGTLATRTLTENKEVGSARKQGIGQNISKNTLGCKATGNI